MWTAFLLTLLAGLATGIGSLMILLTNRTNKSFLSFSLGLSAGVMLYVSFVEILQNATIELAIAFGDKLGNIYAVCAFFGGIAMIAIIDKFIPAEGNPHEIHTVEEMDTENKSRNKLMRMGVFTALAIALHNFPEGIATFVSAMDNPSMGVAIASAIAIHNIPEGIAVAIPIFYASGSRKKAFVYSFLSGLSEPLGAVIGYFVAIQFLGDSALGFVLAAVAGIMVYISLDELLPAAKEYGKHHTAMLGLVLGMMIMAFSLILLM